MKKKNLLLVHINVIAIIIIILVIIIASFLQLSRMHHNYVNTKTENYLYKSTNDSIKSINSKIKELSSSLDTMALFVGDYETIYDQEVIDHLYKYSEKNKNLSVIVINKEGKAYSETGVEYDVSDRAYVNEVLKGKTVVSGNIISKINNEESIIIAVPMVRNEEVIGALACVCHLKIFTEIMNANTIDSKGYSIIMKKDGEIIAKPTGLEYENIFDEILSLKIAADYDEQSMKDNFENNRSGIFEYAFHEEGRFASYAPLGINDWFVLSVIPSGAVEKQHNQINKIIIYLIVITIICFGVLTFFIVFIIEKNNREIRQNVVEIAKITRYMPGGAKRTLADKEYTFLEYTEGFLKLIDYTKEEVNTLFDNKLMNMIYPEDKQNTKIMIQNQLRSHNQIEVEYRIRKKDGSLIWVLDKGKLIIDEYGRESFYCVVIDITSQKESKEQLEYEKEKYKTVLDISDDILFDYDIEKDEINYSEKYIRVMGREPVIQNYLQNFNKYDYIYEDDCEKFMEFLNNITKKNSPKIIDLRLKKRDGTYIWFLMQAAVITDKENKPIKLMGKISNMDNQKNKNTLLIGKSEQDSLTKLYNRVTVENKIQSYIDEQGKEAKHALIIIDIDNFKGMNDELGQLFGDETLKIVAARIKKMFRASDSVGRIGGDEFLVFLKDIISEDIVLKKAEALCEIFRSASGADDKEYKVSASVGISIYPRDGFTYEELFIKASRALDHVKNTGKDDYKIYEEALKNE